MKTYSLLKEADVKKAIMLTQLLVLLLILGSCASGGNEKYITVEQYNSIRNGMTKSQVIELLGRPSGDDPVGGVWQYLVKHDSYTDLVTIIFDNNGRVFDIGKQ
jgi:outer membrane protein assembly factor BamE (lipoprotein component of BamABCDE complex)